MSDSAAHPTAGMLGVSGRIQPWGEVVRLVAHKLTKLSDGLAAIGRTENNFRYRMDAVTKPMRAVMAPILASYHRKDCGRAISMCRICRIDTLKVKTRDFR